MNGSTATLFVGGPQSQDHNNAIPSTEWYYSAATLTKFYTFVAVFVLCFSYLRSEDTAVVKFWKSHPVPGPNYTVLKWLRATLASVAGSKELVDDGYQKYSRFSKTFTIPSFDRGGFVVLPATQLKKLYSLPEEKLDSFSSQLSAIQAQYTIEDMDIMRNPFHAKILTNQIPKNLDLLTRGMCEELELAFLEHWGDGNGNEDGEEGWREVKVTETSLSIVARSMNRVFMGPEACRNEGFVEGLKKHGNFVFLAGFMVNCLPGWARPVVGFGVRVLGRRIRKGLMGVVMPLVEKREEGWRRMVESGEEGGERPQDAIQWAIEDSYGMDAKYRDHYSIAHRILLLNFASIHSTSLAAANTLLDLFSDDPARGTVEDLREECIKVFTEANGVWTKEAVGKLVLLDSAIRESMRISSLSILGLPRRIDDPNGVTLDNGVHIPQGISIITPVEAIHLDPEIHTQPKTFHAFRFCDPSQVAGKRNQVTQTSLSPTPSSSDDKSQLTPDYKFIPFGFGRHACPGRPFALHQAKLMVAYALMNYDIEYLKKKPESNRFLWVQVPVDNAGLRVRKREDAIWQRKFA